MSDRQRNALMRFNWIGGGVMLAVYVLLNFLAPEMHVIGKLVIALLAAVLAFALIETLGKKRRAAEAADAQEEDLKEQ